ncbi:centriole and centriolar satellite protein OFD1 isoform X2 [Tiliqua scincoides]|uniref:centriole and centriolar satellite protein OFD1 isoform X2 n=1 Tax=Tiliqua scincoides TaxID=71010 RepID=UPI003461FD2C
MDSAEFVALSQDELRKRLYQTFKNRGVLDGLKTQLRNQLVHELMNPGLIGKIQPKAVSSKCSSLLIDASNSLVADHLRRCGYEYSLSVFYPESGLEKDKVITMPDLLRLIRISPNTELYNALISAPEKDNTKGFLVQILMELIEHRLYKESNNTETQTSPRLPYKESLAEKLQLIDEQFADKYPQRHRSESLEVKLAEYRKEIEEQLQAEMSQKLQHFKEVEIAKIKMDERMQSQKEVSELRKELERAHLAKSEALTSRERNAIERLQKQQEIDAKEIYLQRQTLLRDIETIRTREAELKQRIEAFELAQKLQESKNETVEDALHRREVAVKNIEDTYDQKLKNELLKYQLELKEEYIARSRKIAEDEKKNKEKAELLHEETISLNSKKEELKQAVSRAKELAMELDSVKAQVTLLSKQNHLLTEKLKDVSDYPLLKEEKMELQVQNKLLKQQLEEAHGENLQLRDKMSRPSPEYVVLQAELKRVENARKLERDEFEARQQLMEKQLQNEVDRVAQLKSQLSECENTIRKLNVQMEDLKLQLKQTQTALENEVYRNPKPSVVDRSVIHLAGDRILPHDFDIEGAFLKTRPVTDIIGTGDATNLHYHHHALKSSTSPDPDLEFVANTKARIKELEREAECLEEAYRNYQHRVIQSTAMPAKTLPSSPLASNYTAPPRQRLWFAQDDLHSQQLSLSSPRSKTYNSTPRKGIHLDDHLTPAQKKTASRRLSSTPVSKAKRDISKQLFVEDAPGVYLSASQQSAVQPLSPILRTINCSVPESVYNISGSSSPVPNEQKMSFQQQQAENQNFSDSAKPEKLHYEDLENLDPASEYQEDIPEQLTSDVSHFSGDIVSGSHVPTTVPATVTSQQDTSGAEKATILGNQRQPEEQQEKEEQNWEKESRDREERRQSESPESLEIEQGTLEKMKEMCVQESLETEEEKPNEEMIHLEVSMLKSEDHDGGDSPNPLEKYMKMIQQNRKQELAYETSRREEVEEISSERNLGSERENSISAAGTLHGEPDEFW